MTTITRIAPSPTASTRTAPRYRFRDVIGSEWIKLRSLRSSRWTFVAFALGTIAIGVAASAATGSGWKPTPDFDSTNVCLAGLAFGELALGVGGVLVMTSEHTSGTIRSTLAAVPRRPRVLAAKAVVYGAAALVVGEAATFATFLGGQAAMGDAPHATLGQPHVAAAVIGSGLFLVLTALFALGLGAMLRSSVAGVATFAGIVLVAPLALSAVGTSAVRWAPEAILSNSVATSHVDHGFLPGWEGLLVMAGYTAAALVGGLVVLCRSDV